MEVSQSSRVLQSIVTIAGLLCAVVLVGFALNDRTSQQVPNVSRDTDMRRNYESALLAEPSRLDAGFGLYVADDGGVYTAYIDHPGLCEMRCMTVRLADGGYSAALPVSYTFDPDSQGFEPDGRDFGTPFVKNAVTQLTYWNPRTHAPETLTSANGSPVKLPALLYRRTAKEVGVGETVYTSPDFIRTSGGRDPVVLEGVPVWYQPGGRFYGMVEMATLLRTAGGFTACLPKSYHALIDDRNVAGIPATILEQKC